MAHSLEESPDSQLARSIMAQTNLELVRVWTVNTQKRWLFEGVHSIGTQVPTAFTRPSIQSDKLKEVKSGIVVKYSYYGTRWRKAVLRNPRCTACRKQIGIDGNRLNADEHLDVEQRIVSQNGLYYMALSGDGIFYLCETQGSKKTLWSLSKEVAGRRQGKAKSIKLRGDDDLWVGEGDSFTWSSTTCRRRDNNGNAALVIGDNAVGTIQADGLVLWSTEPNKVPNSYYEAQQVRLAHLAGLVSCLQSYD